MHTVTDSIRQIFGVIMRTGGQGGGKNETVLYINRGMFLKPIVRFFVFDYPVRFMIPGIFSGFTNKNK